MTGTSRFGKGDKKDIGGSRCGTEYLTKNRIVLVTRDPLDIPSPVVLPINLRNMERGHSFLLVRPHG